MLRDLFEFSAETDGAGVVVRAPGGASFRVGDPELDELLSARYGERLAVLPEAAVSHFDAGPVHVLTTSSLRWVEQEYGRTGGEARRYRPNIVLDTDGGGSSRRGGTQMMLGVYANVTSPGTVRVGDPVTLTQR